MVYIWNVNFKWYIGVLIVVVSYFVVDQQSIVVPNQEIVLTFSESNSSIDYEHAIVEVKKQLEDIGAEHIIVTENTDGSLKVTYYSKITIHNVKNQLFDIDIVNDFPQSLRFKKKTGSNPFQNDFVDYQIDIYEISDDAVSGLDSQNKSYFELKQDFNRGSQVHVSNLPRFTNFLSNDLFSVAEKVNSQLVLTFYTISFQIPEVRAGPVS